MGPRRWWRKGRGSKKEGGQGRRAAAANSSSKPPSVHRTSPVPPPHPGARWARGAREAAWSAQLAVALVRLDRVQVAWPAPCRTAVPRCLVVAPLLHDQVLQALETQACGCAAHEELDLQPVGLLAVRSSP